MSTKRKVKTDLGSATTLDNGLDLFVNAPADAEDVDDDEDESDMSEDVSGDDSDNSSVYSGIGEDEDDNAASEDDSDAMEEDSDDDSDDEDDDDSDDEEESSDSDLDISNNLNLDKVPSSSEMAEPSSSKLSKANLHSKETAKEKSDSSAPGKSKTAKNKKKLSPEGLKLDNDKSVDKNDDQEKGTSKSGPGVEPADEYAHDSSDEEDIRNTVGNIPMEWYQNYPHIGYDIEGRKLIKPTKGDHLDDFLNKADDPNYWRTVTNKLTGQNIVLSNEDVGLIQNLQGKKHPSAAADEYYAPWVEWFTNEVMIHPLSDRQEHKRSFIPSKWEKLKVGQFVHALKMGWMKPSKTEDEKDEEKHEVPKYYMLWKDDESEINKRFQHHLPAPKMPLPGHAESYNPPAEYLFSKEEEKKWRSQERGERRMNFIPRKFSSLRSVPAYNKYIKERFDRCLDLYLCPRQRKMRMNVDPEDLIPQLPKPKDLQPFPTIQSLVYLGHTDLVRGVSVDPSGQWIVSGSDDHTVRVWEVATARCMKTFHLPGTVRSVSWNPNPGVTLVACTVDKCVVILNPGVGDKLQTSNTDTLLESHKSQDDSDSKVLVTWSTYEGAEYTSGLRLKINHDNEVSQVTWHGKGDYFATLTPQGLTKSVLIHQLSKRRSQNPFSKSKGLVQCVRFHPLRPFLFVASQRYVRVYNLVKQELSKKLVTNCKWVSSMAVHPEGDNVVTGSYDCRLNWFDLDLSTKAYKTLRHQKQAVRQVCFHRRYPLFASASDDCSLIIYHGMVYNDLLQNPLIVPVKQLKGHKPQKGVGILDCVFHPSQPWIFSAGADGTVRLYT